MSNDVTLREILKAKENLAEKLETVVAEALKTFAVETYGQVAIQGISLDVDPIYDPTFHIKEYVVAATIEVRYD